MIAMAPTEEDIEQEALPTLIDSVIQKKVGLDDNDMAFFETLPEANETAGQTKKKKKKKKERTPEEEEALAAAKARNRARAEARGAHDADFEVEEENEDFSQFRSPGGVAQVFATANAEAFFAAEEDGPEDATLRMANQTEQCPSVSAIEDEEDDFSQYRTPGGAAATFTSPKHTSGDVSPKEAGASWRARNQAGTEETAHQIGTGAQQGEGRSAAEAVAAATAFLNADADEAPTDAAMDITESEMSEMDGLSPDSQKQKLNQIWKKKNEAKFYSQYKSPGGVAEAFKPETDEAGDDFDFSQFRSPGGAQENFIVAAQQRLKKAELGCRALISAADEGNNELVQKLLDADVPVDAVSEMTTHKGASALYIAAKNGHLGTVQLLLSRGANMNHTTATGKISPLLIACWCDQLAIVEELISHGTAVDVPEIHGATPLFIACQKGFIAITKCLLKAGASINIAKKSGATPLFIACEHGNLDIMKLLMFAQADPNAATEDGSTPLLVACKHGHGDAVELLLMNRANVEVKEGAESPVEVAQSMGHADVVELLALPEYFA